MSKVIEIIKQRNIQLIVSIIIQTIIYTTVSEGRFLSTFNLQSMAFQLPEAALFSFGMMLVILTGGINLALVSTGTMATIVGLNLLQQNIIVLNAPVFSFVLYSLIVGLTVGLFHSVLITKFKVPPIVLTLASSFLFTGIGLNITKGGAMSNLPEGMHIFGNNLFLGIPISCWFLAIVFILLWIYLNKAVQGKQLYMVGSGEIAAFYSGLPVKKIFFVVYILCAILGVAAALVMVSRYNSAKIDYGYTYVLQSVAVVVMAGFNVNGGKGQITNILLAAINFQLLSSGFNILGIDRFFYVFAMGLLLLVITLIDQYLQHSYQKKIISKH